MKRDTQTGDLGALFGRGKLRRGARTLDLASRAGRPLRARPGRAADDLDLATACAAGAAGAWERLERRYASRLEAFAMRRGATEATAAELVRRLPGDLALPPATGPCRTRIGTYDGSCSLFTWLCVILLRRLADRARDAGPPFAPVESESLASAESDPCARCAERETARALDAALAAAWATLDPREAALIRLRYGERRTQVEIAARMNIGPPRVCRLLQRAMSRLRDEVQRRFPESEWSRCATRGVIRHRACHALSRLLANPRRQPSGCES